MRRAAIGAALAGLLITLTAVQSHAQANFFQNAKRGQSDFG
jgi:hypothetical protein